MHILDLACKVIIFLFVGGLFAPSEQPSHFGNIIIGMFLIFSIIVILITIRYLIHRFLDYLMYKNETQEEKKTKQMIDEWRKKF